MKCTGKDRPETEYKARFIREMCLLGSKNLCGYFDIVADYCLWAKRNGILVGPGRGSGGASLVAYLAGITEIDPVDAELPFERFLTPGRTELPDFDIDFPSDRIDDVIACHREVGRAVRRPCRISYSAQEQGHPEEAGHDSPWYGRRGLR